MTKNKYTKRLPKKGLGSWIKNEALPGIGDMGVGILDSSLSTFGGGNIIGKGAYSSDKRAAQSQDVQNTLNSFKNIALNAVLPGAGSVTGALQKMNTEETSQQIQESEIERLRKQREQSAIDVTNYQQTIKNNQANIPTFPNGGSIKPNYLSRQELINNNSSNDAAQFYQNNPLNSPETYNKLIGNPSLKNSMYNLVKGYTGSSNDSTALFTAGINEYTIPYEESNEPQYESMNGLRNAMNSTTQPISFDNMKQRLNVKAEGGDLDQPQMQQPQQIPQPSNQPYIINYKGASHTNGGISVNSTSGNPTSITGEEAGAEVEGKHESNTPQKGEVGVRFKDTESPYIFSDKLGYAKQAEKIQKKYSLRLNDRISQDTMYQELEGLMGEQEKTRNKLIAKNISKIKELGGNLNLPEFDGTNPNGQYLNSEDEVQANADRMAKGMQFDPNNTLLVNPNQSYSNTSEPINNDSLYTGQTSPLGAITNMASNAILMATNKKAPGITAPYINPQSIDLSQAREAIRNNAVYSRANRLASLRGAGLSQAQYAGATSTGDTDINRSVGEGLTQSYLTEQGTNAGYNQQTNMANASNNMQVQQYNAAIQDRYNKEQQEYLANLLNTPNEYLNESQKSQKEALALQMRNPNVSFKQKNRDSKVGNLLLGPKDIYKSYK